jgi:hypothetical protein
MDIPANYTSPDVIDRRNGQVPTLADKVRDLMINVRNDYQSSFGTNPIDLTQSTVPQQEVASPLTNMLRQVFLKKQ